MTQRLSTRVGSLHVAPWPRVYADLRVSGVRGEEAAVLAVDAFHGRLFSTG